MDNVYKTILGGGFTKTEIQGGTGPEANPYFIGEDGVGNWPDQDNYAKTLTHPVQFEKKRALYLSLGLRKAVRRMLGADALPSFDANSLNQSVQQIDEVLACLFEILTSLSGFAGGGDASDTDAIEDVPVDASLSHFRADVTNTAIPAIKRTVSQLIWDRVRVQHLLANWNRLIRWIDALVDQIVTYWVYMGQYGYNFVSFLSSSSNKGHLVLGSMQNGASISRVIWLLFYAASDLLPKMGLEDVSMNTDLSRVFRNALVDWFNALGRQQAAFYGELASLQAAYAKVWEDVEDAEKKALADIQAAIDALAEAAGYLDTISEAIPGVKISNLAFHSLKKMGEGVNGALSAASSRGLANARVTGQRMVFGIQDLVIELLDPSFLKASPQGGKVPEAQLEDEVVFFNGYFEVPPPTLKVVDGELRLVSMTSSAKLTVQDSQILFYEQEVRETLPEFDVEPELPKPGELFFESEHGRSLGEHLRKVADEGWHAYVAKLAKDDSPGGRRHQRELTALASILGGLAQGNLSFSTLTRSLANIYYSDDIFHHEVRALHAGEFKEIASATVQRLEGFATQLERFNAFSEFQAANERFFQVFHSWRESLFKVSLQIGEGFSDELRKRFATFASPAELKTELDAQRRLRGEAELSPEEAERIYQQLLAGRQISPSVGDIARRLRKDFASFASVTVTDNEAFFEKVPYQLGDKELGGHLPFLIPGPWPADKAKVDSPLAGSVKRGRAHFDPLILLTSQIKLIDVTARLIGGQLGILAELFENPDDAWDNLAGTENSTSSGSTAQGSAATFIEAFGRYFDLAKGVPEARPFGRKIDVWAFLSARLAQPNVYGNYFSLETVEPLVAAIKAHCKEHWEKLESLAGSDSQKLLINRAIVPIENAVSNEKGATGALFARVRTCVEKVLAETRPASHPGLRAELEKYRQVAPTLCPDPPFVGSTVKVSIEDFTGSRVRWTVVLHVLNTREKVIRDTPMHAELRGGPKNVSRKLELTGATGSISDLDPGSYLLTLDIPDLLLRKTLPVQLPVKSAGYEYNVEARIPLWKLSVKVHAPEGAVDAIESVRLMKPNAQLWEFERGLAQVKSPTKLDGSRATLHNVPPGNWELSVAVKSRGASLVLKQRVRLAEVYGSGRMTHEEKSFDRRIDLDLGIVDLRVRLLDADGRGVVGAKLSITDPQEYSLEAEEEGDGHYLVQGATPGKYTLEAVASAQGAEARRPIDLKAGKDSWLVTEELRIPVAR